MIWYLANDICVTYGAWHLVLDTLAHWPCYSEGVLWKPYLFVWGSQWSRVLEYLIGGQECKHMFEPISLWWWWESKARNFDGVACITLLHEMHEMHKSSCILRCGFWDNDTLPSNVKWNWVWLEGWCKVFHGAHNFMDPECLSAMAQGLSWSLSVDLHGLSQMQACNRASHIHSYVLCIACSLSKPYLWSIHECVPTCYVVLTCSIHSRSQWMALSLHWWLDLSNSTTTRPQMLESIVIFHTEETIEA